MPIEAPSNCWTKAEAKIATAVANSTAFQSLVNAEDSTEAAAKVFGEQVDEPLNGNAYTKDELDNLLCYAQVYHAIDTPYGVLRTNTNTAWPFGSVIIFIERLVTDEERNGADVPSAVERKFKNRIGDLIDEVIDWLDDNEGPHIRSIEVTDGPGFNQQDRWKTKGMWQGVELTATWGIAQG
jgi:hypothetical protein